MSENISPELKTALEGLESTFTVAQKEMDVKLQKLGTDSADYQEYKAKAVADMVELTASIDEIKAAMNRQAAEAKTAEAPMTEERKALIEYYKRGERMDGEKKSSLIVSDDSQGGYFVDPVMGATIDQIQREISPMRGLVNVVQISSGDALEAPTITNKTVGATRDGELADAEDNNTIAFGHKRIPANWLRAMVPMSMQATDDIPNLESMIARMAAEDFAITEGAEILNGTDPMQAKGIMENATIEQVSSGHATLFTTTGLLDIVGSLKPAYRAGSSFIANRSTIFTHLFGLQDANETHYLVPDFRTGFQFTLLGFPLIEMPDMANTIANSLPLAFGNFRRGYTYVERKQLSLFVDPYTSHPVTKYKWAKRTGGDVVVPESMKIMKIEA